MKKITIFRPHLTPLQYMKFHMDQNKAH